MNDLWNRAQKVIPGGVHSPVRAFRGVGGTPVFFDRGEGSTLYDVNNKSYLDFCMSWGALILGHGNGDVLDEVTKALRKGWTFGAAEPYSLKLAEWMTREIPFLEQVRFVCSGTEAVMSALRLARGFTGKSKVLKFENCYHGCADSLLVKAGSGLLEGASPTSLGITPALAADTIVCPLDDCEAFEKAFAHHKNDIAAVIVEPLPANNGLLPLTSEFLECLRRRTREAGCLLILDEVISGFRVGMGGMAEKLDLTPDLVTYGKVMGGGFPIAAYGGRSDIMKLLAPLGGVYQAGTLAGNPVACVAGLTTLEILKAQNIFENLEEKGARLEKEISPLLPSGVNLRRVGSIFWMAGAHAVYPKLFHKLLDLGVYLAPSAYEVGFLNSTFTAKDQEFLTQNFAKAWAHVQST